MAKASAERIGAVLPNNAYLYIDNLSFSALVSERSIFLPVFFTVAFSQVFVDYKLFR